MDHDVKHCPERSRFEIETEGLTAYVEYYLHDGYCDILHTIVPISLEGQGLGSALVKSTYDWALENGHNPMGSCSFAVAWLTRHPEYIAG